jgi:hypothetical protein
VDEFNYIFHDLFGRRGAIFRKIVEYLAKGPAEYSEIITALKYANSGSMSEYLEELEVSGFISRDYNWSFKTGVETRVSRFRLKDNYLRFYLKYIAPRLTKIKREQLQEVSLTAFPNWEGIMGLQFENLLLNNRHLIWKVLGIAPDEIVSDNPYVQHATTKQAGCQIDYLIQTRHHTLFMCEFKFSKNKLNNSVISEINAKVEKLTVPKNFAILPVLIHVSGVTQDLERAAYFYKIIDMNLFMEKLL